MNKLAVLNGLFTAVFFCVATLVLIILVVSGHQQTINKIVDVSWPNCKTIPTNEYSRAIIGASGGLDFRPNPCLGQETTFANSYELYANTGDPGFPRIKKIGKGPLSCSGQNLVCYSYNYGYQAGLYVVKQALFSAAQSDSWWLDVESINSWTNSVAANRADIVGMINAIRASNPFMTPQVGIYTANQQWVALVGHWQIGLPLWLGTGDTSAAQAKTACASSSVTGGQLVMTQYTAGGLDYNYACTYRPVYPNF